MRGMRPLCRRGARLGADQSYEESRRKHFVTGGVVSSLGKGLARHDRRLLEDHGSNGGAQKFDSATSTRPRDDEPYSRARLRTDDGAETTSTWATTAVHQHGGDPQRTGHRKDLPPSFRRRRGRYIGRTVQVIPPSPTDQGRHRVPAARDVVCRDRGRRRTRAAVSRSHPAVQAVSRPRENIYIHRTWAYIGAAVSQDERAARGPRLRSIAYSRHPAGRQCRFLDATSSGRSLFSRQEEAIITARTRPITSARGQGEGSTRASQAARSAITRPDEAWRKLVDRIKNTVDELTIHVVGQLHRLRGSYKSLNEAITTAVRAPAKVRLNGAPRRSEGGGTAWPRARRLSRARRLRPWGTAG